MGLPIGCSCGILVFGIIRRGETLAAKRSPATPSLPCIQFSWLLLLLLVMVATSNLWSVHQLARHPLPARLAALTVERQHFFGLQRSPTPSANSSCDMMVARASAHAHARSVSVTRQPLFSLVVVECRRRSNIAIRIHGRCSQHRSLGKNRSV